ncbi:MAG TPA: acetate kinase [Bryobacteraceae bacterium]|nr:acetate kinase [Bryobacteraceae bacterium]
MKILVLNGGSSTLKALLCEFTGPRPPESPQPPLWEAHAEWGWRPGLAELRAKNACGGIDEREIPIDASSAVIEPLLAALWEGPARVLQSRGEIEVVGHRVVHGGHAFTETTRVTAEVRAAIARLVEFAPEHNRLELEAILAAEAVFGEAVPQVAVFDTAFHTSMPEKAAVYPGPREWLDAGIRRYGFHGISHQYTSRRAAEILGRDPASLRVITCHLGNGCSLAAVRGGRSVDTTMGFTPIEGLMMGTRSGSIDPGILIYLVRHRGFRADQLDHTLNKESGLKGVSGISGDMREIQAAMEAGNPRARLAFEVFVHRLCREIGGMLASLGGLDALVFTAGIGENSPLVREQVCRQLEFLGLKLDPQKNVASPRDEDIAAPDSGVRVLVIHTEEDWEIARECHRLALAGW